MAPAEQSDRDLIQLAQRHDTEAVAQLYRRYSGQIYRFCLFRVGDEAAAQDLTEDVFLNMVESLPRYEDRGAPFSAWLFRIAHHRVVDYYRREARRPMAELKDTLPDSQPGPEVMASLNADAQRLSRAMGQLSYDYRLVLQLRFVEGFDLAHAAVTMQKTVGATKTMQHRALRQLARLLAQ